MKIQKNISNSNSFLDNSKRSNSSFINNSNILDKYNFNNINNNFRENIRNKYEEALRYLDSFSCEDSNFNSKNKSHVSRNSTDALSDIKKNYFFISLTKSYKNLPLNSSQDNNIFLSPKCKSKIIQIYENSQKKKRRIGKKRK
jgi:hypothetical protein